MEKIVLFCEFKMDTVVRRSNMHMAAWLPSSVRKLRMRLPGTGMKPVPWIG